MSAEQTVAAQPRQHKEPEAGDNRWREALRRIVSGSWAVSGERYAIASPSLASLICKSIAELHTTSALFALAAFSLTKRL